MCPYPTGPTVLIIEDDANDLHAMQNFLLRAEFNVRTANSGWDALKRIKDSPVDIIVSNAAVAEADGSNLREKLMLNPQTRDIPFCYLTPKDRPDILVNALRSGVDECIAKPFDPVVLVARIQAVIERRHAYERMTRIDPLTRLLNRFTLEDEVRCELNRVVRYKRFASIVLIDIDHFAAVNTEAGIAMGDLLLTCLSGVILTNIREMDIAGRSHGEAFFVFLPETNVEGAELFVRRIQTKLNSVSDVVAGMPLSFSCGIVGAPEDGAEYDLLLARVEEALKHAKKTGNGTISMWRRDVAGSANQAEATASE